MGWWPCSCCIGCFYRCFQGRKKNKLNSIDPERFRSPTPSIALSGVSSGSKIDDISIQEQLSVFYFGQTKSASGRRYSHPNQLKWVEEYENQRRASTTSCTPIPVIDVTPSKNSSPPPSPVMMFPVIPPALDKPFSSTSFFEPSKVYEDSDMKYEYRNESQKNLVL